MSLLEEGVGEGKKGMRGGGGEGGLQDCEHRITRTNAMGQISLHSL